MPTYEYRCPNGHEFEKFYRTISASLSELPCPTCGATAARHLSAGAGLVFKGSGFYLTDYGKNAHAKRGDARASGAEGQGGSGAGESKSAAASGGEGGGTGQTAASSGSEAKSTGSAADGNTSTPKKGD